MFAAESPHQQRGSRKVFIRAFFFILYIILPFFSIETLKYSKYCPDIRNTADFDKKNSETANFLANTY